jgi:hypothetical protein
MEKTDNGERLIVISELAIESGPEMLNEEALKKPGSMAFVIFNEPSRL